MVKLKAQLREVGRGEKALMGFSVIKCHRMYFLAEVQAEVKRVPNIKSSIGKRVAIIERKTAVNKIKRSQLRTLKKPERRGQLRGEY